MRILNRESNVFLNLLYFVRNIKIKNEYNFMWVNFFYGIDRLACCFDLIIQNHLLSTNNHKREEALYVL